MKNARFVLCAAALWVGCTKEAPKPQAPDASTPRFGSDTAQLGYTNADCQQFGQALRTLALRRAAHTVVEQPWGKDPAKAACRGDWGERIDQVAEKFWMRIDCGDAQTRPLISQWMLTPRLLREHPDRFPESALLEDGSKEPTTDAFLTSASAVLDDAALEVLRRADALGDGGCPL